jgi:DNA primase
MEAQDLIVQVAVVSGGKDPAELVQKGEHEALRVLVDNPQDSFPYSLGKALAAHDRTRAEGREKVRDLLFPFVAAAASPMRKDGYLALLADNLGVDVRAVRQDFSTWLGNRQRGSFRREQAREAQGRGQGGTGGGGDAVTPDLFLMIAVASHPELFPVVRNGGLVLADLDDDRAARLYVALEEAFRAEEEGFESLCARLDDPVLRDLVIRKVASGEFDVNEERMVADGVRRIRQRALRKKTDLLSGELRRLEKESVDPARMRELLAEKMHLDSELERLKTGAAGV